MTKLDDRIERILQIFADDPDERELLEGELVELLGEASSKLQAENKRLREVLKLAENWIAGHAPEKVYDAIDAALKEDDDG